jgi:hypothetical protein
MPVYAVTETSGHRDGSDQGDARALVAAARKLS